MNETKIDDRIADNSAADQKRCWVTPEATVEQVTDVTSNFGGTGGDAVSCHS